MGERVKNMIYVTGDMHGDENRLFDKQWRKLKKGDTLIVCGDFGFLWDGSAREREALEYLGSRKFNVLFLDGTHENFDLLHKCRETVWHGGHVRRVCGNLLNLMRGQIFNIEGKKIFTFGGASSHDISDGILEPEDPRVYMWIKTNRDFRINHLEWWKEELASEKEMQHGREVLCKNNNNVDYIITHCLPQEIASLISAGVYKSDSTTLYLQKVAQEVHFNQWYCGHYHIDKRIYCKYNILYHDILRVL